MSLWSKLSRNADRRLAQILERLGRKPRSSVTYETGAGTSVPTTAQPAGGATAHVDLSDMPSASVADHDGRYYTETEIGATGGSAGSTLMGTDTTNFDGNLSGADNTVQKALDTLDDMPAGLWTLTGSDLTPTGAGVDVLLSDGHTLGLSDDAATTPILFFSVTGDGNVRLSIEAGGILNWGSGAAAPDIELSRSAAYTLTLDGLLNIVGSAATTGNSLYVHRNLLSSDAAVVLIRQDNAGNADYALEVIQDGSSDAIRATSAAGNAVEGVAIDGFGVRGVSTNSHGVLGLGGAGNNDYGGSFNSTKAGDYADFDDQGSPVPATPPSGDSRVFSKSDGLYVKDDAGAVTGPFIDTNVYQIAAFTTYIDKPEKFNDLNIHGGVLELVAAAALDAFNPVVFTEGIGRLIFIVNAGGDLVGDLTVSGTSVNRDTGAESPADTETITISGATTDTSSTDAGGNTVHAWSNAYITTKWFTGPITLTTAPGAVTISDLDVWHCSFEQFNDMDNIGVTTLDINALSKNANAEFYAHLYSVIPGAGDTVVVASFADIELSTALADRYYRLRRVMSQIINGSSEGIFLDIFLERFNQSDWEDITIKLWASALTQ